ncbi:MAG TPA: TonB-dependent receptor [Rhizomicrobium sp.]
MKTIYRALLSGASAVALGAIAVGPAQAQSTSGTSAQSNDQVETVTVTGMRKSMRDSIIMKQNSDLVTDDISAKDIGSLPDITIAEELNTLPGVNGTRDRGNESQATVRGLGPRLVLGLVNDREIASSEPDQNVRWEIFPSEVVSGVQLYKTQSADMISGGIAGVVNINTLAPLDYDGPTFTLRAGPSYNEEANKLPGNYDPWGLRASGAWVDQVTSNFAIAIGGSFQREKDGYSSFQGWGYNLAPPYASLGSSTAGDVTGDGIPDSTPWGAQTEISEIQQDRTSLIGAAQWRPTSALEFRWDALYSNYDIDESQQQQWYGRNNAWGDYTTPEPATLPGSACYGATSWAYDCPAFNGSETANHVITAATLTNAYSSVTNVLAHYTEQHSLLATGINGKWTSGNWVATGDVSYSEAERNNRWRALETEDYPPTMTFNTGAGVTPSVTTPGYDPADPTNQTAQSYTPGESAGPEHTRDHIGAARFDVTRSFDGSIITAFDFGARYSDRTKSHQDYQWYQCPGMSGAAGATANSGGCGTSFYIPSSYLSEFSAHGFTVPSMMYGNFNQLANLVYGGFGSMPTGADQLAQDWKVHEGDFEGYAKLDFGGNWGSVPYSGNAGVRVVSVDTRSSGYETTDGATYTPISLGKSYTDVLPSANVKFNVADDQVLRFAASEAVSRPPLDELRTGFSLNPTGTPPTGSGGNPLLNPYKAWQLDASWEWYFHEESMFSVAPFYKHLETFIGYNTFQQTIGSVNYTMTAPFNGKGGNVTGFETTFQSRFYFLPPILSDFGVYSNYSFVDSTVHEFTPSFNPLDATGFAKHTAELDLWYSHEPFELRLAYKYHSPFTVIYGWNAQQLTRLDAERTLDFNASYQWDKNFQLRFEAHNLTNTPVRMYWNNDPNQLARYDVFGRSYLLDLTYKN